MEKYRRDDGEEEGEKEEEGGLEEEEGSQHPLPTDPRSATAPSHECVYAAGSPRVTMSQSFDINVLLKKARGRWLKPYEVYCILLNHEKLQIAHEPPNKPPSGSLFLYNRRVNQFFRRDGYAWQRKKDGRTVWEAHERLKVGNVDVLSCYYAHGEQNPCFQRRCFWMLEAAYDHIVLVQYRDVAEGRYYSSLSNGSAGSLSTLSSPNDIYGNHVSTSDFSEGSESRLSCVTEVSSYSANKEYYHDSGILLSIPGLEQSTVIGKPELGQTSLERSSESCMTDSNDSTTKYGLEQALKSIAEQLGLDDDDYIYLNQARYLDFVTNTEVADRQGNQTSNSLGDDKTNQIRAEGTQNGVGRGIPPSWENVPPFNSGLPMSSTYQGKMEDMNSLWLPAAERDIPMTAWIGAAMEGPVTASLGPMAPLLRQVHSLSAMAPEHIQGGSEDDVKRLKEHLEVLCMDLLEPEETSSTPKWWRKEVRELLYDTEDRLDEVIIFQAGDFSELIAGVEDACERRKRVQLAPNKTTKPDLGEGGLSYFTPQRTSVLSKPISVQGHSTGLGVVGIEDPMNKIVEQLAFGDDKQKRLKVIPIVGFPGVGKTTVAGILYYEYRGKFQCSASVRVSRTPDTRSILISILSQIKGPGLCGFPDVHDLIDVIRKHLKGKRYFIIMDDLWTASIWDIISRAFPDADYGSRIITTTQIDDVALACCRYCPDYIDISPLNDDQSKKLFFSRVFGSEDHCPPDLKKFPVRLSTNVLVYH